MKDKTCPLCGTKVIEHQYSRTHIFKGKITFICTHPGCGYTFS